MKEAEKLGDTFVFLSDRDARVSEKYAGHEKGGTLMKSATFVIGRDKKIVYAYVGEDFRTRAGAPNILKAVNTAAAAR
jgi:peroxiredoxin